jgi:hypothetical protein
MNLRESAQQALEVLENVADEVFSPYNDPIGKAILDLRAALEQPEWQGLTDEEALAILVGVDPETKRPSRGFRAFARAIEAKLKERNT